MKAIRILYASAWCVLACNAVSREAQAQSCTFSTACTTVSGSSATVLGIGSTGPGVQGQSTSGGGVSGTSTSGMGVSGATGGQWPAVGIYGINTATSGSVVAIYGDATASPTGWGGDFLGGNGVYGGAVSANGIGVKGYCQANGGCTTGYAVYAQGPAGGTTLWSSSDARMKKDVRDASYGVEQLLKLRPVTYLWKDEDLGKGTQFGLIAQEVQKVFPELVREDPNKMLAVNYVQLIPVLVRAVQQQQAEITDLERGPAPVVGSLVPAGAAGLVLGFIPLGFIATLRKRKERSDSGSVRGGEAGEDSADGRPE